MPMIDIEKLIMILKDESILKNLPLYGLVNLDPTNMTCPPLNGGITFTEVMRSYFSTKILTKIIKLLKFLIDVIAFNVNALVDLEDNSAKIAGTVDTNSMLYNLNLQVTDGTKYRFKGLKLLDNGSVTNAWMDVTTLFVSVYEVIGRGILKMRVNDLITQIETFKAVGTSNNQKTGAFFKFTGFLASTLIQRSYTRFLPLQYSSNGLTIQSFDKPRPTKDVFTVTTEDSVTSKLFRYKSRSNGPVLLVNKISSQQQTLEQCTFDIKAAVNEVRSRTGCENIAVVSHCLGAVVTFMGLLSGEIEGVSSYVASQVGMNPGATI
ncbi:22808_t:CDS:2 [Gigaspora margarita]|uniref:22808_t:CDS:1 n=1 Tax=Gigaspora margarita TaxID=4874 RepID=A0ABN7WR89_GIGMA|nr:22808_t:CDS:2 [Gigaspora margarita]